MGTGGCPQDTGAPLLESLPWDLPTVPVPRVGEGVQAVPVCM